MLDSSSISLVLAIHRPERDGLLELLAGLSPDGWGRPTECPAYSVQGIATHILGDDLSLLSRQRDGAMNGLLYVAQELPGADFRALLDAFNDNWVAAARFMSPVLLVELIRLAGEWTAAYYDSVNPGAPGEPVGLFGAKQDSTSPFWQAIAREYFERWIHHSQIRRAVGRNSLAERRFLRPGLEVVASIARMEPVIPKDSDGVWGVGPIELGPAQQAADILTPRSSGRRDSHASERTRGRGQAVRGGDGSTLTHANLEPTLCQGGLHAHRQHRHRAGHAPRGSIVTVHNVRSITCGSPPTTTGCSTALRSSDPTFKAPPKRLTPPVWALCWYIRAAQSQSR